MIFDAYYVSPLQPLADLFMDKRMKTLRLSFKILFVLFYCTAAAGIVKNLFPGTILP